MFEKSSTFFTTNFRVIKSIRNSIKGFIKINGPYGICTANFNYAKSFFIKQRLKNSCNFKFTHSYLDSYFLSNNKGFSVSVSFIPIILSLLYQFVSFFNNLFYYFTTFFSYYFKTMKFFNIFSTFQTNLMTFNFFINSIIELSSVSGFTLIIGQCFQIGLYLNKSFLK